MFKNPSPDRIQEILHSPFDMQTHAENFINYLEVVISPKGKIEYAVPSHKEKLISIAMEKYNWTRDEFIEEFYKQNEFDEMDWLFDLTGYISVWNYTYMGQANMAQKETLVELIKHGLYKGDIFEKRYNRDAELAWMKSDNPPNLDNIVQRLYNLFSKNEEISANHKPQKDNLER